MARGGLIRFPTTRDVGASLSRGTAAHGAAVWRMGCGRLEILHSCPRHGHPRSFLLGPGFPGDEQEPARARQHHHRRNRVAGREPVHQHVVSGLAQRASGRDVAMVARAGDRPGPASPACPSRSRSSSCSAAGVGPGGAVNRLSTAAPTSVHRWQGTPHHHRVSAATCDYLHAARSRPPPPKVERSRLLRVSRGRTRARLERSPAARSLL